MAPVRSYYNWNQRKSDTNEAIEPYRKYFFICEGANTETWYFEKLVDYKKELGINPNIDIRFLEKTQQDKNISFPRRLIEFAEEQKLNSDISFDAEMDRMIIVFDADIFEEKVKDFDEVVAFGKIIIYLVYLILHLNCFYFCIIKMLMRNILNQMKRR